MALIEHMRRELMLIQEQTASRTEASWLDVGKAREGFLTQQLILEEGKAATLSKQLAVPEAPSKEQPDVDETLRSDGLFGVRELDDGCSISDQDRTHGEELAMAVCNALTSRSKRWRERVPSLPGPSGRPAAVGGALRACTTLSAETDALIATMQATTAYLSMHERMKEAIEEGILQRQDKVDKAEFMISASRVKAAILKLQSLEYHFLAGTYRAEDVVALNKVWEELTTRLQQVRTQLAEAQKRLSVFRGLGPSFHSQLAQYRDVQRRLLDAQYMLENFNKINSELDAGAADMMMGDQHMDCDDGVFGVY
ncbi:hypothetical protein Agub_g13276 [Astrephomene gubernaculifera]|uniref:Uncharacterized protein n=1 Tax=Astrephomene gubernaculifera TaxID=47775 RepID=A0AAD3E3Y9_9CHLO|nr:hypothetical protein Agub_g13276 [Astrephomene gubernaculifera]